MAVPRGRSTWSLGDRMEFRISVSKVVFFLLWMAAFAALTLGLHAHGSIDDSLGSVCVAAFLAGTGLAAASLLRPIKLVFDDRGISGPRVGGITIRWEDVRFAYWGPVGILGGNALRLSLEDRESYLAQIPWPRRLVVPGTLDRSSILVNFSMLMPEACDAYAYIQKRFPEKAAT
jgi:hypothetical protein